MKSASLTTRAVRILFLEPDPYLAFLLRLEFPEAQITEADPDEDVAALSRERYDLVIADLRSSRANELLSRKPEIPVIGITEAARTLGGSQADAVDGILYRPFVPSELQQAVRRALGMQIEENLNAPTLGRVRRWLGIARVAAVIMAAVIELAAPELRPWSPVIFAVAFVYVAARWLPTTTGVAGAWADVIFATGLIVVSGGLTSSYTLLAFVAALEGGLVLGLRPGIIGASLISAASARDVVAAWQSGAGEATQMTGLALLFPLAALTGSLAARIWQVDEGGSEYLLAEANRLLSTLHRIARTIPGGLEVRSVASTVLDEIRETMKAPAALLLVGEAGVLGTAGSFGMSRDEEVAFGRNSEELIGTIKQRVNVVTERQASSALAPAFSDRGCWLVAPLRHGGAGVGVLIAACPDHNRHDENRLLLQHLAEEAAVAVENARLFGRVREMSADEERSRIADELHDGAAQMLTHVRMELDFLARHSREVSPEVTSEAERLVNVVDRAIGEVRSTILALRSSISGEGLGGSLRAYLQDLRGLGGPEVTFSAIGADPYPRHVEAEMFRIAQEAVTTALRELDPGPIRVSLETSRFALRLKVRQEPVPGERQSGGNAAIRLRGLSGRVERMGGRLEVEELEGDGFELDVVVEAENLADISPKLASA